MKSVCLFAAAALLAAVSFAQQPPPDYMFPSDYTPAACAPVVACKTFNVAEFPSAGRQFFGWDMDPHWVPEHDAQMRAAFAPFCTQMASCMATPGNSAMFCADVVSAKARPVCDSLFPKATSPHDHEQCTEYLEVYWMGVDQQSLNIWRQTQACVTKLPAVTHTKPPVVHVLPEEIPVGYDDWVQFFANDPDTKIPLLADITIEKQIIYAPSNPAGNAATYYPFKMPFKYMRVKNADGHTDAVPPMITISAPGYPPVTFRLNAKVPTIRVEMTPAVTELHPGANSITVTAKDLDTGKPIDASVRLGEDEVGYTNTPITLTLPQGKRPEIWIKPFLDRYSDVEIAKAQ